MEKRLLSKHGNMKKALALFDHLEEALELDEQEVAAGIDSPVVSSEASADQELNATVAAGEDCATEQTVKRKEAKVIHEDGSTDSLHGKSIKEMR